MTDVKFGIEAYLNDKASKGLDKIGSSLNGQIDSLKNMVLGYVAVDKAMEFIKGSIDEFIEAEEVLNNFNTSIANNPKVSKDTEKALKDLADKMRELTGIDNDAFIASESVLIGFKNISTELYDRSIKAITDYTIAQKGTKTTQEDLVGSTEMLGKVLNNPFEAYTRLSRTLGITFTTAQKDAIEQAKMMNDTAKAQEIILEVVEGRFNGYADAMSNTTGTKIKSAIQRFKDLQESIGGVVTKEALRTFTDLEYQFTFIGIIVESTIKMFKRMGESVKSFADNSLDNIKIFYNKLKGNNDEVIKLEENKTKRNKDLKIQQLKDDLDTTNKLKKMYETYYTGLTDEQKKNNKLIVKQEAELNDDIVDLSKEREEELKKISKKEYDDIMKNLDKKREAYTYSEEERLDQEISFLQQSLNNTKLSEEERSKLETELAKKTTDIKIAERDRYMSYIQPSYDLEKSFFQNLTDNLKNMLKKMLIDHLTGMQQRIIAEQAAAIASAIAAKDYGRAAMITGQMAPQITAIEGAKAVVQGLATGGIVQSDGIYRMAEANRKEAVIPLESPKGKRMLNDLANNNNSNNFNQNITLEIDGIKLAKIMNKKTVQAKRLGMI